MTLSLDRRATLWGDRTAAIDHSDGGQTYSYADLAGRAATDAGRLASRGIGTGDRIVVLSRNRIELLSLLFAARRLDATLAPISHRLPAETVAKLCDRIDPDLAVVEPRFDDLLADVAVESATFDEFAGTDPGEIPEEPREADTPPLFLHTGGTTGVPKVVPNSERQLEWNAITESVAWGLDDEAVSVVVLPLFHTGGWNLLTLPTLYAGGTVVLLREFDPGEALSAVETYGATQFFAVAAIYKAMADHPAFADTDFSTVEWFMSGGGPCPESVMDAYRERGERFTQGYGLTEGGPNNLYFPPDREDSVEKSDRVGRPFPDCDARLVDEDGAVVEGEGTGELELSGPVTADGYLETEDGTFDGEWVSTGDLAHRDAEGDYAIVGRTDNMFVSGGENVYPEEIEAVLSKHEAVEAVGVVPIPHEKWGRVPKAVVVGDVDPDDLAAFARDRLAGYQVPDEFAFVGDLPTSGPGKLDRDELQREHGE